ncbi:phosphoglucosamine mutase [Candidatus Bathyarchaeota archaeon ex4484_135]|nr:MAG: phosphoglucosamine mutase [Candidatus Bathyarchaeota archaeon ex4484_135]
MGTALRLFGTSGIRGLVNRELTPKLAMEVGMALASLRGPGTYLLARDVRGTGQMLAMAFSSGLMACGGDVIYLGMLPTGAVGFLTRELGAKSGCVVTASHNPPEYNGLKLFRPDSSPFWPEEQEEVENAIREGAFKLSGWDEVGSYKTSDESGRYIEALSGLVELRRKWKVVLDPGCGSASILAPALFRAVGCEVLVINGQPDGTFPGRNPDPRPDTVGGLMSAVRESGADVGFAYDGDADRMIVIDERGQFVPFDVALAAFASYVVSSKGGGLVITTVEASYCVDKAVEEAGGEVLRTKVGDPSVSKEVVEHGAVFGGEPCGAWVIPDVHYCVDGILASLMVLRALDEKGLRPSEFFGRVPHFHTAREKVPCPNEFKKAVMEELRTRLLEAFRDVVRTIEIDGLRVELQEGWVLVRPSGTEPVIRITAEGRTAQEAHELASKALEVVKKTTEEFSARSF